MREFKRRIKGLFAIILCVCVVMQFTATDVLAAYVSMVTVTGNLGSIVLVNNGVDEYGGDYLSAGTGGGFIVVDGDEYLNAFTSYGSFDIDIYTSYPDDQFGVFGGTAPSDAGLFSTGEVAYSRLAIYDETHNYHDYTVSGRPVDGKYVYSGYTWGNLTGITISATPNEYTLNLFTQYGEVPFHTMTSVFNGTGTPLPSVESVAAYVPQAPEYYHYGGWVNNDNMPYADYISADETVGLENNDDIYVYLDTSPNVCKIVLDGNGGTVSGYDPNDYTVAYSPAGNIFDIFSPGATATRAGYTFAGWALDPTTSQDNIEALITSESGSIEINNRYFETDGTELTYYAIWEPLHYNVRFSTGAYEGYFGSGSMDGIDNNVCGTPITLPNCGFTLEGCHFAGWQPRHSGAGNPPFGDIVPAGGSFNYEPDVDGETIYLDAVWEPNHFNLHYNLMGGTVVATGATSYLNQWDYGDATKGMKIQDMPYPDITRPGYVFKYFSDSEDGSTGDVFQKSTPMVFTDAVNDMTIYAIWRPTLYTILFDAAGGQGTMASQAGVSGTPMTLNANQFTNVEGIFAGWAYSPFTGEIAFTDQSQITYTASVDDAVLNLYAVWNITSRTPGATPVGVGTVYLQAGVPYQLGNDGTYNVSGDASDYAGGTVFYVAQSGDYTISLKQ